VADPSALLNALPIASSTPELHLHLQEGENFALIDKLRRRRIPGRRPHRRHRRPARRIPGRLRPGARSNTTPVVVMRFEGENPEALARIQAEFARVILAAKPDADLPF
jgi:phosphomannomutase/phosphoglucomutase